MPTAPTASIVVVGDEILAGHTQDTNSHWVARRLHARGVRLLRVETVPDAVPVLVETLRRHISPYPSFVFVIGGLGPTPDDRTYEAVSQALGRELSADPEHVRSLKERLAGRPWAGASWADPERSEAMNRMVRLPQGALALANPVGAALGSVLEAGPTKVVVFPGVPKELYAMFEQEFEPRFLKDARSQESTIEIETQGAEARLWDIMVEIGKEWPDVRVGSYPQPGGRIVLRLTGPPAANEAAAEKLRQFLKNE